MPASPVPGVNVIPDPVVLSNEEFNAMDAPLVNGRTGSLIGVQPVDLGHYRYEEVRIIVRKIADPILSL